MMLGIALRDARAGILGWSMGLAVLVAVTLASFPSFKDNDELEAIWAELPEGARELFGGAGQITTYPGYLDSQFLSLFPVLLGIFAIMHASRVLAGEEERGRLDLLLSTPLSRSRLALTQGFVVLGAQGLVAFSVAVVTILATVAIGEDVALWRVFLAVMDGVLAAWVVAMVTFLAGAVSHRRGPAALVGTLFLVASYFVGALAQLSKTTDPLKYASITYHYGQSDWLGAGPDPLYILISLGVSALCLLAAVLWFRHKDLTG